MNGDMTKETITIICTYNAAKEVQPCNKAMYKDAHHVEDEMNRGGEVVGNNPSLTQSSLAQLDVRLNPEIASLATA